MEGAQGDVEGAQMNPAQLEGEWVFVSQNELEMMLQLLPQVHLQAFPNPQSSDKFQQVSNPQSSDKFQQVSNPQLSGQLQQVANSQPPNPQPTAAPFLWLRRAPKMVLLMTLMVSCATSVAALVNKKWCELGIIQVGLNKMYAGSEDIDLKDVNNWCVDNDMPSGCQNFQIYYAAAIAMLVLGSIAIALCVVNLAIGVWVLLRGKNWHRKMMKILLTAEMILWVLGISAVIGGFIRLRQNTSEFKIGVGLILGIVALIFYVIACIVVCFIQKGRVFKEA